MGREDWWLFNDDPLFRHSLISDADLMRNSSESEHSENESTTVKSNKPKELKKTKLPFIFWLILFGIVTALLTSSLIGFPFGLAFGLLARVMIKRAFRFH